MHEETRVRRQHAPRIYGCSTVTQKHGGNYLQDTDVLESGEVALGDACEVISIQLPAKKDTQTWINNSSIFPLLTCYA